MKRKKPNYEGKYVALSSSGDSKVIASGRKFGDVFNAAVKLGETIPTIVFIPRKGITYMN
jgi:formylmethanofuran dehydrogenase subunit D